jgi:hypothetical protein
MDKVRGMTNTYKHKDAVRFALPEFGYLFVMVIGFGKID